MKKLFQNFMLTSLDNRFNIFDKTYKLKYLRLNPVQKRVVRNGLDHKLSEEEIEQLKDYILECEKLNKTPHFMLPKYAPNKTVRYN